MGRTRYLYEGFISKDDHTLIRFIGEFIIWKNPEGYLGVERIEGTKRINLLPYEFERIDEILEIIKNGFKGYAVRCKECGGLFQRLGNNHLRKHNMTTKGYLEKYPNSELVSFEYRFNSGERKRNDWENLDSKYKRSDNG